MLANIMKTDANTLLITGKLNFANAKQIYQQGLADLNPHEEITIDLKQVEDTDSAGLALLVAWQKAAWQNGKTIQFINPPSQLQRLAEMTGVARLLNDK